ncbi:hypothetical protein P5673_022962 [Acropora cervicornis]|uniref:Uncharacterized protein n=1 Tax=Acropora cervicornis TaxID=6130 RepID=A0AAD9UZC9_ACRCE|nr:hypothetical protein P5673_022962 [Acropora cervicornis]
MIYHEQIKSVEHRDSEEEVCPDNPQKSEDDPDNEESTDDTEKGMDHGEKEGVAWSEDCSSDEARRVSVNTLNLKSCLDVSKLFFTEEVYQLLRAITLEINGSGRLLGDRSMARRLQHDYHLSVGKHVVMTLLQNIDPDGVNQRRRRRIERRCYRNPWPKRSVRSTLMTTTS